MVMQKQTVWILIALVSIFLLGMFAQKSYEVFSVYQIGGRSCEDWISAEQAKGYIDSDVTEAPFCWLKDGRQERWISEMTPTYDPNIGCKMIYTIGCDTPACSPGDTQKYTCPDETEVDWCECDPYGDWSCISSPEDQCPEEETWTLTSSRSCSEWISIEENKGYIIGENVPFCWSYLGTKERWVLETNLYGSNDCQIIYNQGCEELTCMEYCNTLTHINCVGSWEITGTNYPNCGCNWVCDCILETCSSLGKECGEWDDGCGGTLDCGTCSYGYVCSGGDCILEDTCTDTCSSLGYECGTYDVCGVSTNCGDCSSGYKCLNGECVVGETNGEPSEEEWYNQDIGGGIKLWMLLAGFGGIFLVIYLKK